MVELSLADRGRPGRVACGGGTDFGSISAHVHGTVECKSGNGPRHELTCVTHVSRSRVMPLVKLFTRPGLSKAVPLAPLQTRLCEIWKTTPSTTKLMRFDAADWTGESFDEDIYVDVRAKATPERTREVVLDGMARVQQAFAEHGLVANVRLETCAVTASVE